MKYTIIGDIHGKVEAVETALALPTHKIFVGDFIDSWDRPVRDHRKCYELVIQAMARGEPVDCIYGNHELSYLMPNPHRCSGYDYARAVLMREFEHPIRKYFKPFVFLSPTTLVSHAGLCRDLWETEGLTIEGLPQQLAEWWPDPTSPMHWIGSARGGNRPFGGLFWCDFQREFTPVPGLVQVFGHSRVKEPTLNENSFAIDCLDTVQQFIELEA